MPFAFAPREASAIGRVESWDIPLNEWMGIKFSSGQHDTLFGSTSRFTEDRIWDDDVKMRPDVANKVFGIPGHLQFDGPVSIQRARLMRERKDEELLRESQLQSASHSWISGKAIAGTAAAMVGSISNPLDFAALFFPAVGSSAKAAAVSRAGGNYLSRLAARGVFATEEGLAKGFAYPKFGASVINGSIGNAITEIPLFIQNTRDQTRYGLSDSAINIAAGGALGGILHVGVEALTKALKLSGRSHSRMNSAEADLAAERTINESLSDRTLSGHKIGQVNRDNIIREIQFDEAVARKSALERIGVLPEEAEARALIESVNRGHVSAIDLLDLARFKANTAANTVEGKVALRLMERFKSGERGSDLFVQMADLFELKYNPMAPTMQERLKVDNLESYFGDVFDGAGAAATLTKKQAMAADSAAAVANLERLIAETQDPATKASLSAFQLTNFKGRAARAAEDLAAAEAEFKRLSQPFDHDLLVQHANELEAKGYDPQGSLERVKAAQLEARADEIRAQRMQAMVYEEMQSAKMVEAAERAEIESAVKSAKIMSDEEVSAHLSDFTKGDAEQIGKSVSELESDLENISAGEGARAAFIREAMARIEEPADLKKAFTAAAECLVSRL